MARQLKKTGGFGGGAAPWVGAVITAASVYTLGPKGAVAQGLRVSEATLDSAIEAVLGGEFPVRLNPEWFGREAEGQVYYRHGGSGRKGQMLRLLGQSGQLLGHTKIRAIYYTAVEGVYDVLIEDRSAKGMLLEGIDRGGLRGLPESFVPPYPAVRVPKIELWAPPPPRREDVPIEDLMKPVR